jgi:SAM-dependent methyltransferase
MHDDPYRDPWLYDMEYEGLDEDFAFYTRCAARFGGPILELGVGNGRLALTLARAGFRVHGVDLSLQMLGGLARAAAQEPPMVRSRLSWRQADFRTLQVESPYPLVILPFNALHHCNDHRDVLALLAGVRRALSAGGHLVLDCYLPDLSLYNRDPSQRYEERTFVHPRTGETIESWENGWYDALAQLHHIVYTYRFADGHEERAHLRMRMFWPQELRGLIDLADFEFVEEYGGFDDEPLGADSTKWCMVLRPRASLAA